MHASNRRRWRCPGRARRSTCRSSTGSDTARRLDIRITAGHAREAGANGSRLADAYSQDDGGRGFVGRGWAAMTALPGRCAQAVRPLADETTSLLRAPPSGRRRGTTGAGGTRTRSRRGRHEQRTRDEMKNIEVKRTKRQQPKERDPSRFPPRSIQSNTTKEQERKKRD